jgi:hypothetical protein
MQPLQAWQNFHELIGTAAATLVGLMFVAASVGSGVFTEERQTGLRTFLSPTVVAFSVVLEAALIGLAPVPPRFCAILLGGTGLLGILYSWRVWTRMVQDGISQRIDFEDRVWYTAAPALAYLLFAGTGLLFVVRPDDAPPCHAIAQGLLLLAGIRNAWDMTTWIVLRRPN